ncbi:hypothetical protein ACLEAM_24080, partial [Escherichia coli]|uniref:hypothetical protein n=1 Tax=Escherichia coli TaxID=562 RepID=UPI00397664A9
PPHKSTFMNNKKRFSCLLNFFYGSALKQIPHILTGIVHFRAVAYPFFGFSYLTPAFLLLLHLQDFSTASLLKSVEYHQIFISHSSYCIVGKY